MATNFHSTTLQGFRERIDYLNALVGNAGAGIGGGFGGRQKQGRADGREDAGEGKAAQRERVLVGPWNLDMLTHTSGMHAKRALKRAL